MAHNEEPAVLWAPPLLLDLRLEAAVADPGGGARPPFQKNNKKWGPIFVQFCS